MSDVVRVAIVEDQRPIREGLRMLVEGSPGVACSGAYDSMEAALPRLYADPPHVALVDIGLPGMSGIEGIRELRDRQPDVATMVLSVYDDDDRIFEALCAGASGYLLKNTPPARLLESLQEVAAGGAPMSPQVAHRVITLFRKIRPPERPDCELTPHERRILQVLVDGHSRKSAAAELGINVNTLSFHIKRIYGKLQVHSKSQAVAKALRTGLLD